MLGFEFAFNSPWFLLLVALVPLLWLFSFRSLAGLGKIRRVLALALRTAVLLLLIVSLAEMQRLRFSDKMTVIYLLDQSASIPHAQRDDMVDYVVTEVSQHRNDARRDKAGVIAFGRQANIEVPPVEDDLPIVERLESLVDLRTDATNLASAMKLAQATFPEDSAKRIVVVTDGNENVGNAQIMASLLAQQGVGVDVVPIVANVQAEVAVEKVSIPADIRKGQPFEARVVLNNLSPESDPQPVDGRLRLTRKMGQKTQTLAEQPISLDPGKTVLHFKDEIAQPDFYEYQATFVPNTAQDDSMAQNNQAMAFTHVLGKGHVLLVYDWESPGEFDHLVERLRDMNMQVTVRPSNQAFTGYVELQRYDSVILANVPRSSGGADALSNFSDEQVAALVRNTEQSGCGLVMLGGRHSFGAGGWTNTELEKAMPVDFQIYNAKVVPVGALAMVMHASEMAQGNYWQKVIAREALKALGPHDYCGVIHWTGREDWLWGNPLGLAKVGPNRRVMMRRLSRMTPGDMPNFDPSMRLAAGGFAQVTDAAVKHMIIISDGDPNAASRASLKALRDLNVKVTTVAVGTHGPAGHAELQRIASVTGGKYYVVKNPKALPRIYNREARRVARPLVKEGKFSPQLRARHEILQGIGGSLPPITGFVLTSVKHNPLVEVLMTSPVPVGDLNNTILATWTYGLGRTAVLTTDAGAQWAKQWQSGWQHYDRLFGQLVRWSMRPTGDTGQYTVATQTENGRIRVVVHAMDENDDLLNFLEISGAAVGPKMDSHEFALRQVAPGRYVGDFPADEQGSYFVTLLPGSGQTPIRTGINVPYSSEYRNRETNLPLLNSLATQEPTGGEVGRILQTTLSPDDVPQDTELSSFRHDLAKAFSSQDIWPLLVLTASCVFFGDIFVRRVTVNLDWVTPSWERLRSRITGRDLEVQKDERFERLRSRKAEISNRIDERRSATRLESNDTDEVVSMDVLDTDMAKPAERRGAVSTSQEIRPEQEKEDYTSRLLKAKEQALKNRKNKT